MAQRINAYHTDMKTTGIQIPRTHIKPGSCRFWPGSPTLVRNRTAGESWLFRPGRGVMFAIEGAMWWVGGQPIGVASLLSTSLLPCSRPGCLPPGDYHASASHLTVDYRCTWPHSAFHRASRMEVTLLDCTARAFNHWAISPDQEIYS